MGTIQFIVAQCSSLVTSEQCYKIRYQKKRYSHALKEPGYKLTIMYDALIINLHKKTEPRV